MTGLLRAVSHPLFLDDAVHVTPQPAAAALVDDRPDVFLADIGGYPARVLASRWDRPLVQLSPATVAWDGYEADNPEVVALLHDDSPRRGDLIEHAGL